MSQSIWAIQTNVCNREDAGRLQNRHILDVNSDVITESCLTGLSTPEILSAWFLLSFTHSRAWNLSCGTSTWTEVVVSPHADLGNTLSLRIHHFTYMSVKNARYLLSVTPYLAKEFLADFSHTFISASSTYGINSLSFLADPNNRQLQPAEIYSWNGARKFTL